MWVVRMKNFSWDYQHELQKLGKRIKQIRTHRNLRLLDLEVISGINDSDLSRYEQGKENIEFQTIFKLAKALNVEVSVLTDYEGGLPLENNKTKSIARKAKK
jgi:transcriptional regulator with XRE-family HTH domain